MNASLTEQFREFRAIPKQLNQVSEDVTKILAAVSLIAIAALFVSMVAIGVAYRGN